jgi:hypothetical protein
VTHATDSPCLIPMHLRKNNAGNYVLENTNMKTGFDIPQGKSLFLFEEYVFFFFR